MGSGPRFEISRMREQIGVGITISRFPHALSIYIMLGFFSVYFGFGRGYDEN